jgi:hypothetical protein
LKLLHHTLVVERQEIRIRDAVVAIAGTHVSRCKGAMGRVVYITERCERARHKIYFLGGTRCLPQRYTKNEYRASNV